MERTAVSLLNERRTESSWARTCYALDMRADGPVVLRADKSHGRLDFAPAGPGDLAAASLRKDTVCAACMYAGESFAHWLDAPFPSFHKARRVFPALLDIQLPFALEDCVYRFVGAHRTAEKKTASLAVGARLSAVNARLEAVTALGVDPIALDQEGLALWTQSLREIPAGQTGSDAIRVVVSLGPDRSTAVVGRGEAFLGAHAIRHDEPGRVNRILKNYFPAKPASIQWVWTGPLAADTGLVRKLHDEFTDQWPGPSTTHDEPDMFLARALATRALLPGPLRCNLRTGSMTHPVMLDRGRTRATRAAALMLVAGLLLIAVNLSWGTLLRHREAGIDNAFVELRDALAGYNVGAAKGEDAIRIVRDSLDKRRRSLQPFASVFEPSLMKTVAAIVETGTQHDLRYETLSVEKDRILVSGTAGDWKRCEKLPARLRQAGYNLRLDRKQALDDARIPFTLSPGDPNE